MSDAAVILAISLPPAAAVDADNGRQFPITGGLRSVEIERQFAIAILRVDDVLVGFELGEKRIGNLGRRSAGIRLLAGLLSRGGPGEGNEK